MRCSDRNYYVVKFQNNPQGKRVLANEMFGALLAKRLGLTVAEPVVIEVSDTLIKLTEKMTFTFRDRTEPCRPGLSFGSRYVSDDPHDATIFGSSEFANTYLPRNRMMRVTNLPEFIGMLVFDRWTSNSDNRQVVFVRNSSDSSWLAHMIDQGWCFGGVQWDFPDCLREGVCVSEGAYESITGIEVFEPWLDRVEHGIDETVLEQLASQVPTEWYDGEAAALRELVATLDRRRRMVRQLLLSTWEDYPRLFPSWIQRRSRQVAFAAHG
jgi:hypothetical protein